MFLRWKTLRKKDFLLRCLATRDSIEFRVSFARWLAKDCRIHLVRRCFSGEPDRYLAETRRRLLPAEFQRILGKLAKTPADEPAWMKMHRRLDEVLPPNEAHVFSAEIRRLNDKFRTEYVDSLTNKLSTLHPYRQIEFLNHHLRSKHLLPRRKTINQVAERDAQKIGLTTVEPCGIRHSEVQYEFYQDHHDLEAPERASERLWQIERGDEVVRAFVRPEIMNDGFYLREIAQMLRCLPQRGDNPSPVWNYLHRIPILGLLQTQFRKSDDRGRLAQLVKGLLTHHLDYFGTLKAKTSMYRSRPSLGCFKNTMQLAQDVRDAIRHAAGWPEVQHESRSRCWKKSPGSQVEERVRVYRLIHRTAVHNRDIVEALRGLFFHDLPVKELRTRSGLYQKLMPALHKDVALLVKFLFSIGENRKPKGLLQLWQDIDAPGSSHRLNALTASAFDWELRNKRDGKSQAEYLPKLEELSGLPPTKSDLLPSHVDSHRKRRKRLGLK